MPWLQIKFDIDPAQSDLLDELLLNAGSAAVTFEDGADQPLYEPDLGTTPLWQHTRIVGLFDAETDLTALLQQLGEQFAAHCPNTPFPRHKAELLEDKDWVREWMDSFEPIAFGQRLWVCPSWKQPPDPTAANLILDPGLAFGTGTHPTTALCLEWLDSQALDGLQVIDYGCGSGILGIAALLLGAEHVLGVDLDPQALQATRDNLARNGLADTRLSVCYPRQVESAPADLLVANILAGPLVELAPTLAALVKPGGRLALSGILANQADEVSQAYQAWFDMEPPTLREEWVRLNGRRRSSP